MYRGCCRAAAAALSTQRSRIASASVGFASRGHLSGGGRLLCAALRIWVAVCARARRGRSAVCQRQSAPGSGGLSKRS
eukprot:5393430-Pleurochrysis_carterae.AAC.1